MNISIQVLDEPELEFGKGLRGVDPKNALGKAGPFLCTSSGDYPAIPLGLVAPRQDVVPIKRWLDRMQRLLLSNEGNSLRYARFPGLQTALGVKFVVEPHSIAEIDPRRLGLALAEPSAPSRFDALLELYLDAVASLSGDTAPKAILVFFPEEIAELRIQNPFLSNEERRALQRLDAKEKDPQLDLFDQGESKEKLKDLLPQATELLERQFHRAFKARAMSLRNAVPTQVIRRHTFIDDEASQSPATRAWNLAVALFYKTGNIPWRPASLDDRSCFAGISFHHLKTRGGSLMYSSVAHAFSNDLEPFILRGTPVPQQQTRNKQPYLLAEQAQTIMDRLIKGYVARTGVNPSRVILHKTSMFQPEEAEGFTKAAAGRVPETSMVSLRPTGFRLLRRGSQEPLRGTVCQIENEHTFLFTTGFVKWWDEYPGPHIPAPIEIFGNNIIERSREILTLCKMNWNSADGLGRFPITLSFSSRVGKIMTELQDDAEPNPSYRFYM
jgi:hypothetical protein